MKRKPVLMEKIKLKKKNEVKEKETLQVPDQVPDNKPEKKNKPVATVFDFVYKILVLIINLIISIFDSLQWILISVILTIAAIIIIKYTGIDIGRIIDKGFDSVKKLL